MSDRLFKRDGIWYVWVPKRGGGTRKVTTNCTDKDAAKDRAKELEREAVDPSYAAANKATTSDACDRYVMSRKARGRAEGTLHFYGVKLGHVVRLMPARLNDIDAVACESFIATRMAEGAKQTTVKKEIRALGSMLRHAGRLGLYTRNLDTVIPELEDTYEPRERFLMPLELVALLYALPRERAAHVVFIVATGARWGESVRACRDDVDAQMVSMRGTKTQRSRGVVPVPPTMRVALAWSLANATDRSTQGLRLCAPNEKSPPLFASWGNVRRDLAVACAKIGIAPVTPNDLRRTFGTWLRKSGVTTDLIGAAMRHTTSRMAELVYGRIGPDDLDRLISERGPALMLEEKESKVLGLLMGSEGAEAGTIGAVAETPESAGSPAKTSARGRNRTADTGIFNPIGVAVSADESANSGTWRAANGLTFRARARRWLTRAA